MLTDDEKVRIVQQFCLEDRPSGEMVRLENSIETAAARLDELADLRESTVKKYHTFMKALSDDVAAAIRARMQRTGRNKLN